MRVLLSWRTGRVRRRIQEISRSIYSTPPPFLAILLHISKIDSSIPAPHADSPTPLDILITTSTRSTTAETLSAHNNKQSSSRVPSLTLCSPSLGQARLRDLPNPSPTRKPKKTCFQGSYFR